MIHLDYLGTSSVILRLTKVSDLVDPFFTFQIIDQQTKNTIIFTSDNISPIPLIYDEFVLSSVTHSNGLTQGQINVNVGIYTYNIYESNNQYNLNIGSASFLRTGELRVDGDITPTYSTFRLPTTPIATFKLPR